MSMDVPNTPGSKVIDFLQFRESRQLEIEQELVDQGIRIARNGLSELNFPDPYEKMAQVYFDETNLLIMEVAKTEKFPEGSCMTIARKPKSGRSDPSRWQRLMLIHPEQIIHNYLVLEQAYENSDLNRPDEFLVGRFAQLWAIFSQVAGIAGEAAYVVTKYSKPPNGFNGHSPHYNAQEFISSQYKERVPWESINVAEDALHLRYGLALYLLGAMLRSELVGLTPEQAEGFISDILAVEHVNLLEGPGDALHRARAYPHSLSQLTDRLSNLPFPNAPTPDAKYKPQYGGFFVIDGDNR